MEKYRGKNQVEFEIRPPRVILRTCPEYRIDTITAIIRESLTDLDCRIKGNVFIKPNVVTANKKYIHHAYTHPAVVESMIKVLKAANPDDPVWIGESGGFGTPTRLFLKESGYFDMAKRIGIDVFDLNEHAFEKVPLKKGVCHHEIMLSTHIKNADFKIWMPKLKYHVFASITHALKLNMGILYHKERMAFHDHRIHEKIVDLLEPGYPDLIVSDAIDITYGPEASPYPVRLGVLIIADHPLAADVVAAHIMGYRPENIQHLKIAADRGYGSLELDHIDITGDINIETLRAIPKGNPRLFQSLGDLDTSVEFFAGHAPDTETLCDGGCECSVKGCLGAIEKKNPGALAMAKKGAIVTGIYNGDVILPDAPVLLVGDCTRINGRLECKKIYTVKGCPVPSTNLFAKIPRIFGLPNPVLNFRDSALFLINTVEKFFHTCMNRFSNKF